MSKEVRLFSSKEELEAYLTGFGIPVRKWGQGNAKAISHLFSEIENGDTELVEENGQILRRVCFVNIDVMATFGNQRHRLVEDRQVFDEGTDKERVRQRGDMGGAVREKMHPKEQAINAARRAIHEELSLNTEVNLSLINEENIDRESPSYPGLRTQYGATYFATELIGNQIKPEGYKEVELDKTTYFIWTKQLED